jgi:hypothetical protein
MQNGYFCTQKPKTDKKNQITYNNKFKFKRL